MRRKQILVALAITVLSAACVAKPEFNPPKGTALPPPEETSDTALVFAGIDQTVTVNGPRVTPLAVLEDSRCPMNARCVWAGQVRLSVRIETGAGPRDAEIVTGKPLPVADGTLELMSVQPDRVAGGESGGGIAPGDYRFGFSFAGGI